jgi:hypothetical protein
MMVQIAVSAAADAANVNYERVIAVIRTTFTHAHTFAGFLTMILPRPDAPEPGPAAHNPPRQQQPQHDAPPSPEHIVIDDTPTPTPSVHEPPPPPNEPINNQSPPEVSGEASYHDDGPAAAHHVPHDMRYDSGDQSAGAPAAVEASPSHSSSSQTTTAATVEDTAPRPKKKAIKKRRKRVCMQESYYKRKQKEAKKGRK